MKKLLCVLLTLTVCFGLFSAALADDNGEFFPTTLSSLEFTAEQWMSSGSNRATFSLLMYADYREAVGIDLYDLYLSAVGEKDGTVYLVVASDVSSLIISYKIGAETASWRTAATPDLFDVIQYELPEGANVCLNANTDLDSVYAQLFHE